jgi:hypothetical protein
VFYNAAQEGAAFYRIFKEKMMKHLARISFILPLGLATVLTSTLISGCGGAGGSSVAPQPMSQPQVASADIVPITAAMLADKAPTSDFRYHLLPVRPAGTRLKPMSVVFPADMTSGGGPVLTTAKLNDIYVNTTAAAVGTPATFQANYNVSTFIHVLDQYDGVSSNGKFGASTSFSATVPIFSNMISQDDLFNVIHAAAKTGGTGYGHVYNVFLKKGLDTCMDFGPCYSPDNPSAFAFCAYHGSITYSDIGHVIYTIMPYQDVAGCGDFGETGLPNAAPIDSTATTLSHEIAESISDPDPNTGWFNTVFGMEVADVCADFRATETLNAHKYLIQPIYSNSAHGCFF